MPDEVKRIWLLRLNKCDPRDVDVAVEDIVHRENYFPTMAKFLGYVAQANRHRVSNERKTKGPVKDEGKICSEEMNRYMFRQLNRMLKRPLKSVEACDEHLAIYKEITDKYPHLDFYFGIKQVMVKKEALLRARKAKA